MAGEQVNARIAYRIIVAVVCCISAGYELYLTNFGYGTAVCLLVAAAIIACSVMLIAVPVTGSAVTLALFALSSLMQVPLPLPVVLVTLVAAIVLVYKYPIAGIIATAIVAATGICNTNTIAYGMTGANRVYIYLLSAVAGIGAGCALRSWRQQREHHEQADALRAHCTIRWPTTSTTSL